MASKNRRYVGEHRLVMAEVLGRWLTSDEIVHHKDEDKQNNDPANLELRTRAEHMRIHYANKPRPSAAKQPRENGKWVGVPREPREPGKRGPAKMSLAAKVWPKIDQSAGPDECHPWMSVRNKEGYGKIGHGKSKLYAARVVYELVNGPIEDPSLVVRHTCDNPPCCNPKHLILGTKGDNNRDRSERRRGREHRQYGEANTNVKIKDADISRIHELYASGMTQMEIAAEFGVKQPQISRILSGNQRQKGSSNDPG
jgi:predicted XRE-type DNA-binding protein